MREIIESFEQSINRLKEILQEQPTIANRDSAIKRFELTCELAWKSLQKYLREEKILCYSPKDCLKQAFKLNLIQDDERWLNMIEDRNLSVHVYDESFAIELYKRLPNYLSIFEQLLKTFKSKL
ncbi:MAG: HI0074 family nucleotidyltransferase substrate-binding subunit [Patescibacteria group bacterium]|jgi:nucleotidyltransferase substrate binding protein (TIGR01987 family)